MDNIQANPVEIMKKSIYLIKNNINGKMYIGQTKDVELRFKNHCKKSKDPSLITQAILEYGKENFSVEILESNIENYNDREKYWIKYYDTLTPNGYNILDGGCDPPTYCGEDSPSCKLSDKCLESLKKDLKYTTLSFNAIAKKYDISKRQVSRINSGISRTSLEEKYPLRQKPNLNGKLSEDDVENIIELLKYTYFLNGQIARMYGVDVHAISKINEGKTHKKDNIVYPIRKWKSSGKIILTYEQVTEIIDLLQHSTLSLNKIAKKYNVKFQTIQFVNNGNSKKYFRDNIKYPIRSFS